jgi:hypothetical protein
MDLLNFNFGVDVTIKKLRPGAKFTLSGTIFSEWDHELPPPTWDEVMEQLNKDIEEYKSLGGEIIG